MAAQLKVPTFVNMSSGDEIFRQVSNQHVASPSIPSAFYSFVSPKLLRNICLHQLARRFALTYTKATPEWLTVAYKE
eukprot:3360873-Amphidinium_carterae.1